jgi:hypothetical protein
MRSAGGLQTSLWRGCPIRNLRAHGLYAAPPERFAGLRVLHRPSAPRHPPGSLSSLFPRLGLTGLSTSSGHPKRQGKPGVMFMDLSSCVILCFVLRFVFSAKSKSSFSIGKVHSQVPQHLKSGKQLSHQRVSRLVSHAVPSYRPGNGCFVPLVVPSEKSTI